MQMTWTLAIDVEFYGEAQPHSRNMVDARDMIFSRTKVWAGMEREGLRSEK